MTTYQKISCCVIDVFYYLKSVYGVFANNNPPASYKKSKNKNFPAIIFVPGVGGKWGYLKQLADSVSQKKYSVYIAKDLGFNLKSIPESAKIIRDLIDKNDIKHAVIVGHSKGGIIGKYLLVHCNTDNAIKKVIAIASPFSGSAFATIVPLKAFKDFTPNSPTIKNLQSNSNVNNRIVSIIPKYDQIIWAKEGSYLKRATNIYVSVSGHHRIVFDKEVEQEVLKAIQNA